MMRDQQTALDANIRDVFAEMREANHDDAECDAALAALRRVKLACQLFASALDAERAALDGVMLRYPMTGARRET